MGAPDYLAAAAALFNSFTFDRVIPLLIVLVMGCLFIWVLFQAQKRGDFDASQFLRNDRGMLEWGRLAAFICCTTHTWVVFTRTISEKLTFDEMLLYCVVWSGSMILLQALETWRGVRTNTPLPDNPMSPPFTAPSPPAPPPPEGTP